MSRGRQALIIRVGQRVVPSDMVLGVGEHIFKLKENQIIEVLDIDVYGKGLVTIEDKQVWMWAKVIDQCSNEVRA